MHANPPPPLEVFLEKLHLAGFFTHQATAELDVIIFTHGVRPRTSVTKNALTLVSEKQNTKYNRHHVWK